VRGQHSCHCNRCRLVEDFFLRRADAEPHASDPSVDPGMLGEGANEFGHNGGGRLGPGENPQISSPSGRNSGDPFGHEAERISDRGSRSKSRAHDAPLMIPATTGAILSTSTAIPRSFGWSPSGWLSSGFIATPSRKNG